jgi:protein-disulfide isomerase
MKNLKVVIGVMVGGLLLVGGMVFGLSKMEGEQAGLDVEVEKLVDGAGWVIGGEDYKLTVVEFSDLQCPACKQSKYVYRGLKEMDGVRYVYRHLPLVTIHKNAWVAAKATEAAKEMGKGWEMVDLLFAKQEEWSGGDDFEDRLNDYAILLDLDVDELMSFYKDKDLEDQIVRDAALADELKLPGTPTFFVEGEQVAANFVLGKVEGLLKEK